MKHDKLATSSGSPMNRLKPRSRRRSLLIKLILLSASVSVALVGFEVVLRFVYPNGYFYFCPTPHVRSSKEFTYHVYMNSWKIRDREFTAEDLKKKKILFLGDSMVYGMGVEIEDTFPKLVETQLVEAGSDFMTLNAGEVNTGTRMQLDRLLQLEEKASFELVCWVFFLGNDADNNYRDVIVKKDNSHVIEGAHGSLGGLSQFLALHSILYNVVYYNLKASAYKAGLIENFQGREVLLKEYDERANKSWEVTSDVIAQVRSHFESKPNSKVVFLILPEDFQVDTEKQALYSMSDTEFDIRKPNRILVGQLEKNGLPYLDVTDALQERYLADPSDRHYYALDRHFNAKGHRLVASQFLEYARAQGLLP